MAKINDIFWSAQGEGLNSGTSSIFIRLAGCSLRCPYCDTRGAWSRGREMGTAAIAAAVDALRASYPRSRLVFTGGEPLEQDLKELFAVLKGRDHVIAVETNGLHFQDLAFDWWTVSPKDVAAYRVHPQLWQRAGEIKLVVTASLGLDVLAAIRQKTAAPIVLQPEHGRPGKYRHVFDLFEASQHRGIAAVRLGAQLHRIFRVP
ncbi:MAG TPA: 7-carboxy-7-deazaguanine synthase QueE [Candidatus Binatia bacterium]|nr:7-carboxy-7-deazaguanine synthase QueE [Candidatus Binatia bacterium]